MAETLADPQIALGIPFGDSNLQTPDAAGLPSPPWTIGSLMAGKIYGAGIASSLIRAEAEPDAQLYANKYGCGRSIWIPLDNTMDGLPASLGGAGSGNAVIKTPPTWYGYVPAIGQSSYFFPFSALLVLMLDLKIGQQVYLAIEQYNASGTLTADDLLGSFTSSDNTSGEWLSFLTTPTKFNLLSATQYFRLAIYFKGSASTGIIGIDFLGLGWQESSDTVFQSWTDHYVGRNQSIGPSLGVAIQRTPQGGIYASNQRRGVLRLEHLTFEFMRASQAWRDDLQFYWHAQSGQPSVGDPRYSLYSAGLEGKLWPLLLRPRRPGIKQALYCRMMNEPFLPDIDNALGFVEDSLKFSGVVQFEELIF